MPLPEGQVFYYSLPQIWDAPPHPKIVIADAKGILIFVTATHDPIVTTRHCLRAEKKKVVSSLVTLIKVDCNGGQGKNEDGWVDCNLAASEDAEAVFKDASYSLTAVQVPHDTLMKIKVGILSSPMVPEKIKKPIRASLPS
jgi:hypothetical protein